MHKDNEPFGDESDDEESGDEPTGNESEDNDIPRLEDSISGPPSDWSHYVLRIDECGKWRHQILMYSEILALWNKQKTEYDEFTWIFDEDVTIDFIATLDVFHKPWEPEEPYKEDEIRRN